MSSKTDIERGITDKERDLLHKGLPPNIVEAGTPSVSIPADCD